MENKKIIEVIIIVNPPIGSWAFLKKGCTYQVIDCGQFYKLYVDKDKSSGARCLPKDFVAIIN